MMAPAFKRHWLILSVALGAIGLAAMAYRHAVLGYPLAPDTLSATYTVQAEVRLRNAAGPVKTRMILPDQMSGFERLDENFVSRGFGLTIEKVDDTRTATWTIRRAGAAPTQSLYYRATLFQSADRPEVNAPTPPFPERPSLDEPVNTALTSLVAQAREQSADIESFAGMVFQAINDPSPGEQMELLREGVDTSLEKVQLAELILHGARIPTLRLNGIRVEQRREIAAEHWLAVHNGSRWLTFSPSEGRSELPRDFLIWWTGDRPVATVTGAQLAAVSFSVNQVPIEATELAQLRGRIKGTAAASLSLLELPVQTQSAYAILLMVPLGAFVIVILRNLVGIKTFGTFMPVLIAIAFRETQLLAGVALFLVVTSIGLLIRFYLEHLRLLLVPRLATVLMVVILLMIGVGLLSHKLGIDAGLSITLFPMVILAMVIERMSIVWEERGPAESIKEGLGSLVVAAVAYEAMGIELFRHIVFVFPESLLVLMAFTIALGRYTGYRLSELVRFREFEALTTGEQPAVPDDPDRRGS